MTFLQNTQKSFQSKLMLIMLSICTLITTNSMFADITYGTIVVPSCNGLSNGAISFVDIAGGSFPFNVILTFPDQSQQIFTIGQNGTISHLPQGNYSWTICSSDKPPICIDGGTNIPNVDNPFSVNPESLDCYGLTLSGTAVAGNKVEVTITSTTNSFIFSTIASPDNGSFVFRRLPIPAGTYTVDYFSISQIDVTCQATAQQNFTIDYGMNMGFTPLPGCNTDNGVLANFSFSPGLAPFTVQLLNSNGDFTTFTVNQGSSLIFVQPGTYTVYGFSSDNLCSGPVSNVVVGSFTNTVSNLQGTITCMNSDTIATITGTVQKNNIVQVVPGGFTQADSNGNFSVSFSVSSYQSTPFLYFVRTWPSYDPTCVFETANQTIPFLQVTPTVTSACGGQGSISLFIQGGSGSYLVDGAGYVNNTPVPAAPGTYTLLVTDANNPSLCNIVTVTVQGLAVSIAPFSSTICAGSTLGLTANVSGGIPNYHYLWSGFGVNGQTGASVTTPSNLPAGTNNYSVAVTDSSSPTSCTGSAQASVTVSSVNVSVSGTTSVCPGGTINLQALVSGGVPPYSYEWVDPNGNVIGSNQPTLTVSPAVLSGIYSVKVIDFIGCSGSNGQTVLVQQTTLPVSINPTSAIICAGNTTTLSAVIGATGSFTYQWSGPNGFSATTPTITTPSNLPLGVNTFGVVIFDSNSNCFGTSTAQVTVLSAPSVTLSGTTNLCIGGRLNLTAAVSPAGSYTYSWTQNGNPIPVSGNTVTVFPAQSTDGGIYQVSVTDNSSGCTTMSNQLLVTVDETQLSVTVQPAQTTFCAGQNTTTTLTANVANTPNASGSYTYLWSGTGVSGQTTSVVTTPGNLSVGNNSYQVLVTDSNTNCFGVGNASVNINALPSLSLNGPTSPVCVSQTFTLTATPTGTAPFNYAWTKDGNPISPTTPNTIVVTNAQLTDGGAYAVIVTDANGCISNQASFPVTVTNCLAPITVTAATASGSTTITAGATTTLIFSVSNNTAVVTNPTADVLTNIAVTVQLPSCFQFCRFIDASNSGWQYTVSGNTVIATLASLAPGSTATFDIVAKAKCPKHKFVNVVSTVTADNVLPSTSTLRLCVL